MRLLVTRPQHQAASTIKALEEDGHDVIASPLLIRSFLDLPQPTGDVDIIVLTSRNAVDGVSRQWPQEGRREMPVFAVGDATAKAAQDAGFAAALSCKGDAGDLVHNVADACKNGLVLENLGTPMILYPCALKPARDLPGLFEEEDLQCAAWPVYAMEEAAEFSPDALAALDSDTLDAVLLYSARSAATFARLVGSLENGAQTPRIFALSPAICTVLPAALSNRCKAAGEPNEQELRFLLSQHKS